jgi:hypothetical protein
MSMYLDSTTAMCESDYFSFGASLNEALGWSGIYFEVRMGKFSLPGI